MDLSLSQNVLELAQAYDKHLDRAGKANSFSFYMIYHAGLI